MRMAAGVIRVGLCMGVLGDDQAVVRVERLGCLRREYFWQDDEGFS